MKDKVAYIAPIWNYFPTIVTSMLTQRHPEWELLLLHDGPAEQDLISYMNWFTDDRIDFIQTPERKQQFGHPLRQWALQEMKAGRMAEDCDYVVITNADNYHAPAFNDMLITMGFHQNPRAVAAYCGFMVHNYFNYGVLETFQKHTQIDICTMMIRKDAACEIGWDDMQHSSDWTFIEKLGTTFGKERIVRVPHCLVVHN